LNNPTGEFCFEHFLFGKKISNLRELLFLKNQDQKVKMTNAKAKNPTASSHGLRSRQPEDSANTVDLGNENANGVAKDAGMMKNSSIAKKIAGLVIYTIAVCIITIYVVGGNGGVDVGQGLNSGLQSGLNTDEHKWADKLDVCERTVATLQKKVDGLSKVLGPYAVDNNPSEAKIAQSNLKAGHRQSNGRYYRSRAGLTDDDY